MGTLVATPGARLVIVPSGSNSTWPAQIAGPGDVVVVMVVVVVVLVVLVVVAGPG